MGEETLSWVLEYANELPDRIGFQVHNRRRVVARMFAGLGRARRRCKDDERRPANNEGMACLAMIRLLLQRLAVPA